VRSQSQTQSKNLNAIQIGHQKPILASSSSSLDASSDSLRTITKKKKLVGSPGVFASAISNLFSFVSLKTTKKQSGNLMVGAEKERKPLLGKEAKVNILKHEQKKS